MAKARIKREQDVENGAVKFTVLESGKTLNAALGDLPQEMVNRLALHGLNAKVGDSAASPEVDALEAMTDTWNSLKSGVWAQRAGGGGGPRITQTVKVLHRVEEKQAKAQKRAPKTLEEITAWVADQDDEKLKAIRKHPDYQAAKVELEQEMVKAKQKEAKDAAPLQIG